MFFISTTAQKNEWGNLTEYYSTNDLGIESAVSPRPYDWVRPEEDGALIWYKFEQNGTDEMEYLNGDVHNVEYDNTNGLTDNGYFAFATAYDSDANIWLTNTGLFSAWESLSVTFWIKCINYASHYSAIMYKKASSAYCATIGLYTDGGLHFHLSSNGTTPHVCTAGTALTLNTWQHVAMRWNKDTNTGKPQIFINATEVASYDSQEATTAALYSGTQTTYIGANGLGDYLYNSRLDNFRIYNTYISNTTINNLYTNKL